LRAIGPRGRRDESFTRLIASDLVIFEKFAPVFGVFIVFNKYIDVDEAR
jgi:hypothetical protein